jgi:hypothetical protein
MEVRTERVNPRLEAFRHEVRRRGLERLGISMRQISRTLQGEPGTVQVPGSKTQWIIGSQESHQVRMKTCA